MAELRILLNNGHGSNTAGKRWSFEGKTFYEWESNRDTVKRVAKKLQALNIPYDIITPETIDIPLSTRAQRVNALCAKYGAKNCLLLSVHSNASQHHNASGISVWTSKGQTKSDEYAEIFYKTAKKYNPNARMLADLKDGDHDFEESFYMVRKTLCPAVLVESYFYDYKADFDYLMSEAGREAIANWYVDSIKQCIELYKKG